MYRLIPVTLSLLLGCGTAATSTERSTLDTIPKAAADALRAQAGSAEITQVHREGSRNGEEYFEGAWLENGLEREAKVSASGKVVELEKELRPDEVPVPVRDGATKALPPKAVITYVLLMNGSYEVEAIVDGKEYEAVFAADGTRGKDDDDDDDDDDDEHEGKPD